MSKELLEDYVSSPQDRKSPKHTTKEVSSGSLKIGESILSNKGKRLGKRTTSHQITDEMTVLLVDETDKDILMKFDEE